MSAALPCLPVGVHMAVVDPGVGTTRLALAVVAGRGDLLVGPDNGLLLAAAERLGGVEKAFSLENEAYLRSPAHPTFHARDVFAPAAAYLSLGVDAAEMGPEVDPAGLVPAPWGEAKVGEGAVYATVIDVDRFGSLRLNAYPKQIESLGLRRGDEVLLDIGEEELEAVFVSTFGDVEAGTPIIFEDSSGVMAAGISGGSMAARSGAGPGCTAIVYGIGQRE